MPADKVLIIQTGGTIDKDYPRKTGGYAFEITTPAISRIFQRVNPLLNYKIIELFKKDSTDIIDNEREELKKICCENPAEKILITHGTDTLIETANFLGKIENKCIVLTGAFLPEKFKDSDADFNIGFALGILSVLSNGTYLAMNAALYDPQKVSRDKITGKFIQKSE